MKLYNQVDVGGNTLHSGPAKPKWQTAFSATRTLDFGGTPHCAAPDGKLADVATKWQCQAILLICCPADGERGDLKRYKALCLVSEVMYCICPRSLRSFEQWDKQQGRVTPS